MIFFFFVFTNERIITRYFYNGSIYNEYAHKKLTSPLTRYKSNTSHGDLLQTNDVEPGISSLIKWRQI